MVTDLDKKLVPVALNLIERFGTNAIFHVPDTKTFDPDTNETTEGTVVDHTRKISPPDPYTKEWVDGKLVILNDYRCYVAASGIPFTPTVGYKLTFEGKIWQMIKADPLYSGDLIAAYWLQIRESN